MAPTKTSLESEKKIRRGYLDIISQTPALHKAASTQVA